MNKGVGREMFLKGSFITARYCFLALSLVTLFLDYLLVANNRLIVTLTYRIVNPSGHGCLCPTHCAIDCW